MSLKLLKSLLCLSVMIISFHTLAKVELTLEELRKEVLNENLDVRLQYEKYYQAQKNVSVALGQFLPSANINLINVNATFAILQSVTPTPSEWFEYQSSKELRMAEKFTSESIKLNILEGLTVNFINLKHHEVLMASLKTQDKYLVEVYDEAVKNEQMGIGSANEVFAARRNLLQHRQDMFQLDTLMIAEKQALMVALNRSPDEEVILGALSAENASAIPAQVEEGAKLAINNSTELVSNSYQAEAAQYMIASKRWSFISFNGIGFDYSAVLKIEKSKARVIALQKEQIALKIKNQVYAVYEALDLLAQRIEIQKQVVVAVTDMANRNRELYEHGAISFTRFHESRSEVANEERALMKLKMERTIKIAQLKRVLGLDASLNGVKLEEYEKLQLVKHESDARRDAKNIRLVIEGDKELMKNIFSVTYNVEKLITDRRLLAAESNLAISFKATKGEYKVTARIQLVSGDVITKEDMISIK